jgi:hypothetical protein
MDFVHCFNFENGFCFHLQVEKFLLCWTPWQRLRYEHSCTKRPSRVGICPPEDGNKTHFENVMGFTLKTKMINKMHINILKPKEKLFFLFTITSHFLVF